MPSLVPNAKRIIEEGISVAGFGQVCGQTYESNVPFVLRCASYTPLSLLRHYS